MDSALLCRTAQYEVITPTHRAYLSDCLRQGMSLYNRGFPLCSSSFIHFSGFFSSPLSWTDIRAFPLPFMFHTASDEGCQSVMQQS